MKRKSNAHTSKLTRQTDKPISEWQTRWMHDMGDILIHIVKQNGWPTPTPLLNIFKQFPPPGKEGTNDDNDDEEEEETLIVPLDYERVLQPTCSSTKGVVIRNPSIITRPIL
ncbi:hypothetical protein PVK06_011660 [Gossypium arboreum]|uniref:Uncharacterized protein n=1 Tax=Gossypium arboreum TaxID=29729 RepID=A0ABR0QA45_GOSAR|nr:hypothetical protein PVK06_011660 [Gossypium arboreum]